MKRITTAYSTNTQSDGSAMELPLCIPERIDEIMRHGQPVAGPVPERMPT